MKMNSNRGRPSTASSTTSKKVVTIVSPKEELVSITPNERNWRGICIALLVIIAVLGLILFFIVLLSPPYEGPMNPGTKFEIEHVTGSDFKSIPFNGTWISSKHLVYRDEYGGVTILHVENRTKQVLINNATFRMSNAVDFKVSADMKYILTVSDIKKVYANTKKAVYRIQEVNSPMKMPVTIKPVENVHNHEALYMQEVEWSPTDNALIFIHENDIYYKPQASSKHVHRLTYTGSEKIKNGIPDFMYQEEFLKDGKAVWFSPDGKYLAYAVFDATSVGELKYTTYNRKSLYPEVYSLYYPKAGTKNADVTVKIIDLLHAGTNRSHISLKKPEFVSTDSEPYLVNVVWAHTDEIAVIWLNRAQTKYVISVCFKPAWACQNAHEETAAENSWLDPNREILFSQNGSRFLTILSVPDGSAGRFPHVFHVDINSRYVTPLTHGKFVVTSLRAWDYVNHVVYFEAAPHGKPAQRHLYNVSDNLIETNNWMCLTCPIENEEEEEEEELRNNNRSYARFNSESKYRSNDINETNERYTENNWPVQTRACLFVKSYFPKINPVHYYVLECLGPDVPKTFLIDVKSNSPIFLLDNRTELANRYAQMAKPQRKLFQIELEKGYHAQVKLLCPPVLRERLEMEFPFVLYIGASPGSQSVTEEWTVDWNTYLVSNLNFIVGTIDARGSSAQSDDMKFEIKTKIGVIDVEDQLSILLYLKDTIKYIDRERIGVWGKGYGGYLSSKILEQDKETIDCAIAVSPIANWDLHLSVWTERLLGLRNVTDNYRWYEEADLTKRTELFHRKRLLIMHGTADKTVHYQHTMNFVRALSKENVVFRQLIYPDEDHDFETAQIHVLKTMESFWNECFGAVEYENYEEGLGFLNFAQ